MNTTVPNNLISGDEFTADYSNDIVNAINSKQDKLVVVILTFNTYDLMKSALLIIGTTQDVYQIVVLSDEKRNNRNLTNYIYTNGTLNWVATTPVSL